MQIKGMNVTLYEPIQTGIDGFGNPVYEFEAVVIENVLVAPGSSDDILSTTNLTGKKAIDTLAIPKSDNHDWTDKKVEFFGQMWKTFGIPLEGIEENIPLEWNKKVMVERYE